MITSQKNYLQRNIISSGEIGGLVNDYHVVRTINSGAHWNILQMTTLHKNYKKYVIVNSVKDLR